MEIPIPESWKDLWEKWDIRAFIILSLSLQIFLFVIAPFRNRSSTNWIFMPLMSAYLLADWVSNLAVGFISKSQRENPTGNSSDLLAFWAPFLLVHLGGPDTITAFALEDNEPWIRHFLTLIFQSIAALYVFFLSLPTNRLWLPTLLLFLSGIIKFAERTRSMYLASLDSFRVLTETNPGPNYANLIMEYFSKKYSKQPTKTEMIPEPGRNIKTMNSETEKDLTETEIVFHAQKYFNTFKGLIVDLTFSSRERIQSREFFLNRTPSDAFTVMQVELNLMYDLLFTKFSALYTTTGYIFRFISFSSVVVAFCLFLVTSKEEFISFDVGISYSLLYGAIALDSIAVIGLLISHWFKSYLNVQKQFSRNKSDARGKKWNHLTRFFNRRWSESINTFNLINYCLNARIPVIEKVIDYLGSTNFFDTLRYVRDQPFNEALQDLIFFELKRKADMAGDLETAREISAARGEFVLRVEGNEENMWNNLMKYIVDVDYDQSLLLWHIATELCYIDEINDPNEPQAIYQNNVEAEAEIETNRGIAKLVSDYMLYLLIMQPILMSPVTGTGRIVFRDTCAELKKFLKETPNVLKKPKEACKIILDAQA